MKPELKIEFATQKFSDRGFYRYVYWRVVPSELGFFRRLFNFWKKLYLYKPSGYSSDLFSSEDFKKVKNSCKTVGDIIERDKNFEKLINKIWED